MFSADLNGKVGKFDINALLSVDSGSCTALIGPSGAGKTTVLRMIAGLHPVDSGTIKFGSEVWFDSSARINLLPEQRSVGMVFQQFALFPRMTALGNVGYPLSHLPAVERDQRAHELLAMAGIESVAKQYPTQLSGGERQRVAVARALAREPSVLLLDEPFSSLDGDTGALLRSLVAEKIAADSIACIVVTHDPADIDGLATTTVRLDSGDARMLP